MGAHAEDQSTVCRPCANRWKPPIAAIWSFSLPSRIRATAGTARFNLFDSDDDALFQAILRGEFNISGLQNKSLRRFLPELNSGQVSRLLKRLRLHGLIKKVAHGYKYYVTTFGKDILAAGLKLRELVLIPQLAYGRVA